MKLRINFEKNEELLTGTDDKDQDVFQDVLKQMAKSEAPLMGKGEKLTIKGEEYTISEIYVGYSASLNSFQTYIDLE